MSRYGEVTRAQIKDKLIMRVIGWQDQLVKECLEWIRIVKGTHDPKILEAYEAGMRKGYMDCFNTLILHDLIKNGEGFKPS